MPRSEAMQVARDRVVEAAREYATAFADPAIENESPILVSLVNRLIAAVRVLIQTESALLAIEAQEKEQADGTVTEIERG